MRIKCTGTIERIFVLPVNLSMSEPPSCAKQRPLHWRRFSFPAYSQGVSAIHKAPKTPKNPQQTTPTKTKWKTNKETHTKKPKPNQTNNPPNKQTKTENKQVRKLVNLSWNHVFQREKQSETSQKKWKAMGAAIQKFRHTFAGWKPLIAATLALMFWRIQNYGPSSVLNAFCYKWLWNWPSVAESLSRVWPHQLDCPRILEASCCLFQQT